MVHHVDAAADLVELVVAFVLPGQRLVDGPVEADAEPGDTEAVVAALDDVAGAVDAADLDPDEDEETIESLLDATADLSADLEEAEEWDDLSVVQKMRAQGFYDQLVSENRKDFPPELSVVRIAEAENRALAVERNAENVQNQEIARIEAQITAEALAGVTATDAQKRSPFLRTRHPSVVKPPSAFARWRACSGSPAARSPSV